MKHLKPKRKSTRNKSETARAKKRCWDMFSRYVRLRDALKTTGRPYTAFCCTCGKEYPAFGPGCLQAGHFIIGRHNSVLFDERNCHAQCLTGESPILMRDGSSKRIDMIRVGDELLAFNERSFDPEKSTVETVASFTPKTLYRVEMEDGSEFYATGDHRVVANGEWVQVKDMLHNPSTYDIHGV